MIALRALSPVAHSLHNFCSCRAIVFLHFTSRMRSFCRFAFSHLACGVGTPVIDLVTFGPPFSRAWALEEEEAVDAVDGERPSPPTRRWASMRFQSARHASPWAPLPIQASMTASMVTRAPCAEMSVLVLLLLLLLLVLVVLVVR